MKNVINIILKIMDDYWGEKYHDSIIFVISKSLDNKENYAIIDITAAINDSLDDQQLLTELYMRITSLEKPLISEKYTRLNIKERCSSTRHILSAELFSIKMEGQMFWKR